ncbi:hypothetical protein E3P99_01238 [Wallemia hederae]|uniref:BZIP domain-containing protein n=1 Tax=Wallemia hederae TaxID=1540922 RepID=A0A4T0FTS7_9BASI|nr:hypothetical protein E3P99_01238 [Wallemia hederae]
MTEIENYLNLEHLDQDYKLDLGVDLFQSQPAFDIAATATATAPATSSNEAVASTSQHGDGINKAINTNELTAIKEDEEVATAPVKADNEEREEQQQLQEEADLEEADSDTNSTPSSSSTRNTKRKRTQKDVNITSAAAEANLSPQEYNKLSSKEKRQLRNKISARAFRLRRKDYIEQLESQLNSRDEVIEQLRHDLKDSKTESNDLRKELQSLKAKFEQLSTASTSSSSSLPLANTNKDLGLFGNTPATPPINANFMSVYTTLVPQTNIKNIYDTHYLQPPPAYSPSADEPPSYTQSVSANLINKLLTDSKVSPLKQSKHHDLSSSFASCLKI